MLGNRKIVVDEWAEVWDLLKPHADGSFWQWPTEPDPDTVYIVGRVVLKEHWYSITAWATRYPGHIVFILDIFTSANCEIDFGLLVKHSHQLHYACT